MKTALYLNQPVHLPSFEREQWHKLYLASRRGTVTCLHCGDPLKMTFSIHEEPYFHHTVTSSFDCINQVKAYEKSKISAEERKTVHGFILPRRTEINQTSNQWKSPDPVSSIPAFVVPKEKHPVLSPYRQRLSDGNMSFDHKQWDAVIHTNGPLLLLAGAGSGKTRVLTARAAHMITEDNIPINQMALVTFTAKAAKEMRERMRLYPGISKQMAQQLLVRTFHSLFIQMLQHADPHKWDMSRLLKWPQSLLKEVGLELRLDESKFAYDQALTQISWWKNHMLTPSSVSAKTPFEEKCLDLYKRFEDRKETLLLFDFDDVLVGCLNLLQENKTLLERYQHRFTYLSIDEFQDINKIQFEIIKLLAEPHQHLCVVGDDDQSIYAFRGSNPAYIQTFTEFYPSANTIHLNANYRSNHPIVASAQRVIEKNNDRLDKQLFSQKNSTDSPLMFYPLNEEEEATMVIEDIYHKLNQGCLLSEIAILYRTNVSVRALLERLLDSNIPFSIDQKPDCFYERPLIRRALSFLRISLNEDSNTVVQDLLQALFIRQEKQTELKQIQQQQGCTLLEAFPFLSDLLPFQQKKLTDLPSQCRKVKTFKPYEALTFIENELGFKDTMRKQGQEGNKMEKGSDDFKQLKVVAKQFETVEAFLNHADHIIAKQASPFEPTSNGIQLMTIHRSKGLEFNYVYILGCVDRSIPHEYALDALREGDEEPLQEERRLMYVAITRAIKNVFLSIPTNYRDNRSFPSRFLRPLLKSSFHS